MKLFIAPLVTGIIFLVGCASTDPSSGSQRQSLISVQYGIIQQVEQVKMQANYGGGALLGGGLGLAAASSHSASSQAGAAVAGALLGALIAKSTAGTAEKYTVRLTDGSTVAIVTEHHDLVSGDCVSVEQGQHANIRRITPTMCDTPVNHPAYAEPHEANEQEAAECHTAKQELLNAKTEQETDIGYRKMQAFCEH